MDEEKNYFDCYDAFCADSFDLIEQFVLALYQNALVSGMTPYEADHAVDIFIQRLNDPNYRKQLIRLASASSFVFPG